MTKRNLKKASKKVLFVIFVILAIFGALGFAIGLLMLNLMMMMIGGVLSVLLWGALAVYIR